MTRTFTPHGYQREAMQHIYDMPRCALWMPMGGGKTVSTLTALDALDLVDAVYPVLVLAPKRVARSTWPAELEKWSHLKHLRVSVVIGTPKQRQAALDTPADIYTTNYDNLVWLVQTLGDAWPFKTVVADELTRLKSFRIRQGSKRAGALGRVAHSKVTRFIGLTGTPGANGLKDLWGQTWFLDRGERLGRTFSAFQDRWFRTGYDGFSMSPMPHAQGEIEAALKDICLTVSGLPVDEPIFNMIEVDLPPAARGLYEDMERDAFAELAEFGIEAVNPAVKMSKCLAEGTEVLTDSGWKPIEECSASDYFWDGVEWVSACGSICNGLQNVVNCWGVQMTPDHKVWTNCGWKEAKDVNRRQTTDRPYWADVWLPDGYFAGGVGRSKGQENDATRNMALPVRVRSGGGKDWVEHDQCKSQHAEIVRMQDGRNAGSRPKVARHDGPPSVGLLEQPAISLRQPERQRLEKLWATRGGILRRLVKVLGFLGRHGVNIPRGEPARASGQFAGVFSRQLSLGYAAPTSQQSSDLRLSGHPIWPGYCQSSRAAQRVEARNGVREDCAGLARRQASSASLTRVYDIINCGPRNRFTVRGAKGNPFIVHNCLQIASGALYVDDSGAWQEIHDAKLEALESVVEEANGAPVLVAYNFKSDLARLRKRFPQARVLDADPQTIVDWNAGKIALLFAHPKSAGHGLNLADGGNILAFFGLDWSLEEHMQIIERIGPMRQKQAGYDRPVLVHFIVARDTVDATVLERLRSKRSIQDVLLEAMKRKTK